MTGFTNIVEATDSTYTATPTDTTYYRLITSTMDTCVSGNCADTSACMIVYPTDAPIASIADVVKCADRLGTIEVSPSSGATPYSYNWSGLNIVSGQGTDRITTTSPGTYMVTVTDNEGCTTTASGEMTFQSKICLPATFTIKQRNRN